MFSEHEPLMQSLLLRQPKPMKHFCAQLPPQSVAVSSPFCVPSWHDASGPGAGAGALSETQTLDAHMPVTQSPLTAQPLPTPQSSAQLPPQSLAVSSPSLTPLKHDDPGGGALPPSQTFNEHDPLLQSLLLTQPKPMPHFAAQLPPQSLAVSSPFCTPSKHGGGGGIAPPGMHMLKSQKLVRQSLFARQALPVGQRSPARAQFPPQSVAVSSLSWIPLKQSGGNPGTGWQVTSQ